MAGFELIFPDYYSDTFDETEVEVKGWFSGAKLSVDGNHYTLNFYDPVRLGQTVADDLQERRVFFEPNLVVVKSVTRANMQQAAQALVQSGQVASLIAE
jgi:hypothetical protein